MTPRTRLGAPSTPRLHLSDRAVFWWLLGFLPLGVVAAGVGVRATRVVRARLATRRASATNLVSRALDEARRSIESAAESDARAAASAASAAERAVVLAIEGAVGLKARALVREQLARELEARGLEPELAAEIRDLLNELDTLRFTGNGADQARPAELVERTSEVVRRLGRARARRANEATV